MATYKKMSTKILRSPPGGVDNNFKMDEDVDLSDAVAKTEQEGLGKWKGISVQFYNFIIGEEQGGSGSIGNDDPQFVGLCMCPNPQISATREFTDVPENSHKFVGRIFGTYGPLNSDDPVRFGLVTSAFNNDTSEAWEGIVKALGGDLSNALQTALTVGGAAVPGISPFGTPGAVAAALVDLVKGALTDDPEPMSSDEILLDTVIPIHWWRKVDQEQWVARKFQVYREPNGPGWYMTQWFITLDNKVKNYRYQSAAVEYASLGVEHALSQPHQVIGVDLAAMKVLGGQRVEDVAKVMKVSENELRTAVNSLREDHESLATGRMLAALAYQAKILS